MARVFIWPGPFSTKGLADCCWISFYSASWSISELPSQKAYYSVHFWVKSFDRVFSLPGQLIDQFIRWKSLPKKLADGWCECKLYTVKNAKLSTRTQFNLPTILRQLSTQSRHSMEACPEVRTERIQRVFDPLERYWWASYLCCGTKIFKNPLCTHAIKTGQQPKFPESSAENLSDSLPVKLQFFLKEGQRFFP